jgi:glycosyltransferase involved in cell wall biosynthesis
VTDIKGVESGAVVPVSFDLVMAWIDSSEEAIYNAVFDANTVFASRIPGWKSVYRAANKPLKLRERISAVVCCNPELAVAAEKVYPNAEVVSIINGVDPNSFYPNVAGLGVGWGWVGRMHDEQKDVAMLQEVKSHITYPVKIMTQTWKDNKIQAVKWPEEMCKFYQNLYGWFRTSRHEGSSNAFLEACACGLPVVATPTGVAFRVLEPEFLCTCARHIVRKIKDFSHDRQLAVEVGKRNRETVLKSHKWIDRKADYLRFFDVCEDAHC